MGLVQTTAPGSEPVTLTEAKAWARITETAEDSLIEAVISSARQMAEEYTRRQFITASWTQTLDRFPSMDDEQGVIRLQRPPLISVTSIQYYDQNGTLQTLSGSNYAVDVRETPGRLRPAYGLSWPATRRQMAAVTIVYQAGYGSTAASVPQAIRDAIKMYCATFLENRLNVVTGTTASELPQSARFLLDPYRVREAA